MMNKILFVDDDANILSAVRRQSRNKFAIETALGGEEGLAALAATGPYAVVVSDLRMPGMDGIQFLARVQAQSADTVRIMLTGNADIDAAIAVVNEGGIFRFLTKPVEPDTLAKTLEAGIQQHGLITAERELLQKTLSGSVKVLIDMLSLVNPVAFNCSSRLKRYVHAIAIDLGIPNLWQYELAALLSQIGCVALSADLLEKVYAGKRLTPEEESMYESHPAIGSALLAKIPRLESVAEMIARQHEPVSRSARVGEMQHTDPAGLGARILCVVTEFDRLVCRGKPVPEALAYLRLSSAQYDPIIVAALESFDLPETVMDVCMVRLTDLVEGMRLDEDVRARNGLVLASKGQEISSAVLERLRWWSARGDVGDPVRVLVPHGMSEDGGGEGSEESRAA